MNDGLGWKEAYLGGSASKEEELFQRFQKDINRLQKSVANRTGKKVLRGFHAKTVAGVSDAEFAVDEQLPKSLQQGLFRPCVSHRAIVRFSNSISEIKPDRSRQGRGIAIRIFADEHNFHDLLLSDSPASHARDANQFMAVAAALVYTSSLRFLLSLVRNAGLIQSIRMLFVLFRTSGNIHSIATQTYWSRTAFAFGPYAARLVLKPMAQESPSDSFATDLGEEFRTRLLGGPVEFTLFAQLYADERTTPIEDGSKVWSESIAPPITIGRLTIPSQNLNSPAALDFAESLQHFAFNPWNVHGDIRPLGSLNRARKAVYQASAALRNTEK